MPDLRTRAAVAASLGLAEAAMPADAWPALAEWLDGIEAERTIT